MLRKLAWFYTAGFLGIFLICHTPGLPTTRAGCRCLPDRCHRRLRAPALGPRGRDHRVAGHVADPAVLQGHRHPLQSRRGRRPDDEPRPARPESVPAGPGPADFSLANWAINMPHIILATLALDRVRPAQPPGRAIVPPGSVTRRRGIPGLRQSTVSRRRAGGPGRLRGLVTWRRVRLAGVLVCLVAVGGPALFIATQCYGNGTQPPVAFPEAARDLPNFTRPEAFTYLTLPEWLIVYGGDEYGQFIARQSPSGFRPSGPRSQSWSGYGSVCGITKCEYRRNGVSPNARHHRRQLTAENIMKGLYEGSIGRVTNGWRRVTRPRTRMRYERRRYGTFMHTTPWYNSPSGPNWPGSGGDASMGTAHPSEMGATVLPHGRIRVQGGLRMADRRGDRCGVRARGPRIHASIEDVPPAVFADGRVQSVRRVGQTGHIVTMPRYEAFTQTALAMHAQGVRFLNIAGNDEILVTAIGPAGRAADVAPARVAARTPLATDPARVRLALRVRWRLSRRDRALDRRGHGDQHLYDY